jgi:hypothetical protein
LPETVRVVGKCYAIDENRNIVAWGNSWEEVEGIMKKGYKRSQYYILTVVEAGRASMHNYTEIPLITLRGYAVPLL